MSDVAPRVASLSGFEPGDLELGSQRGHRHKNNTQHTTQDAAGQAYLVVPCEACAVISFPVTSKFERELTDLTNHGQFAGD